MIVASSQYKEIMKRPMRNRAYLSIGVGVISQEAQNDAVASGSFDAESKYDRVFKDKKDYNEYACYDEDFWTADGTMLFAPRNHSNNVENGIITSGNVRVDFGNTYNIRGLTINFGSSYPTSLKITTSSGNEYTYSNNQSIFSCDTIFGDISYIIITPITMVGGNQKMRIHTILLGVGLSFTNVDIQKATQNQSISPITSEISFKNFTVTIFDTENLFNVEDSNSYIDYLETEQPLTFAYGLELDNGTIEWLDSQRLYLSDWQSAKGQMTFKAVDKLTQMNDKYTLGNTIHTRTAYAEAVSILTDLGLEPDDYEIDEYLQDVTLLNPMPEAKHSECLQLLANACRSVVYQDNEGKIVIRTNFARVVDPTDIQINASSGTDWSLLTNLFTGADVTYADLSENFYKVNDTMFMLPADNQYLTSTGYVSAELSSETGYFTSNPYVTFTFQEAYRFYSLNCNFGGNPPKEIIVHTYLNNTLVEDVPFNDLKNENVLFHNFEPFNKLTIEFVRTEPYNRIILNKFNFSELSDYELTRNDMLNNPNGYKDTLVKNINVKVFTFENDEHNKPKVVEDNVYYTNQLNTVGNNIEVQNQLINTLAWAESISEWLKTYYNNNIYYDVNYRGEPRISATDIIKMESEVIDNLEVEVTDVRLDFNGAFKGTLSLHKYS